MIREGVVWGVQNKATRCEFVRRVFLRKEDELEVFFFFFKQKTAYEIVSRDWSSDVCSSDLTI